MTEDAPQLYLIAPALITASELGPRLSAVLDAHPVACLRLPGAGDETELGRIADIARDIAHARDVAVVIEDHVALALRHGLDGVHLTGGARPVRHARKELGADAIVGAFCGGSRHEGMNAGEAGADYVSFGPCGSTALGLGEPADGLDGLLDGGEPRALRGRDEGQAQGAGQPGLVGRRDHGPRCGSSREVLLSRRGVDERPAGELHLIAQLLGPREVGPREVDARGIAARRCTRRLSHRWRRRSARS